MPRTANGDRALSESISPVAIAPRTDDAFRHTIVRATVVAFAIRVLAILVLHTYKIRPFPDHFEFGWEMGRIARSIVWGEGFSSPFGGHTGPTAWEPPLYVYLMAGVFKVFGIYSKLSAFVLLTFNSLCAALTTIPVMLIGARIFNLRVARWAGWAWALFPYFIYWAIRIVWETSMSALLVCLLVYLSLRLAEESSPRLWAASGLLWAVIALANPSVLSLLPCFFAWIIWRRWRAGQPWFGRCVLAGLIFLATITPWEVRNYEVFGRFVFIRTNFGAEFRMGNTPSATGFWMNYLHPVQNPLKMQRYEQLGELAYVHQEQQQAFDYIRREPTHFLIISVRRFVYFWNGIPRPYETHGEALARNSLFLASSVLAFMGLWLAWRNRVEGRALFASTMLVYPLVYYFVYTLPRYRHIIEPEMLLLICYLISEAKPRTRGELERAS